MRIGCLQFAPQVGDVDNNLNRADAVLSRANPDDLDLLVLPELAFSGYNFKSLQDITPFLEPSGSGITSLWARTIALKYNCTLAVGYPEKVDVSPNWPTGPEYYNSVIVVNGDGETIANYRKSFLYYTDETWALEGNRGFYDGFIPGLGNTTIGICMDINPYKFEAPWHAFEFAFHVLEVESNLVIVSMAWMTREEPRRFTRMPNEPDMETLTYWVTRLEPLIRSDNQDEIIVVFCNRCGNEDEALYAGTSAVIGIHDGEVKVYGLLGRGEKELLVVDTNNSPYAKLVYRPEAGGSGMEAPGHLEQTKKPDDSTDKDNKGLEKDKPLEGQRNNLDAGSSDGTKQSKSPTAPLPPLPQLPEDLAKDFRNGSSKRRHPPTITIPKEPDLVKTYSARSPGTDSLNVPTPSAPSPTPMALRPRLIIPESPPILPHQYPPDHPISAASLRSAASLKSERSIRSIQSNESEASTKTVRTNPRPPEESTPYPDSGAPLSGYPANFFPSEKLIYGGHVTIDSAGPFSPDTPFEDISPVSPQQYFWRTPISAGGWNPGTPIGRKPEPFPWPAITGNAHPPSRNSARDRVKDNATPKDLRHLHSQSPQSNSSSNRTTKSNRSNRTARSGSSVNSKGTVQATAKDEKSLARPSSPKSRNASRSRIHERSGSAFGDRETSAAISQHLESISLRAESVNRMRAGSATSTPVPDRIQSPQSRNRSRSRHNDASDLQPEQHMIRIAASPSILNQDGRNHYQSLSRVAHHQRSNSSTAQNAYHVDHDRTGTPNSAINTARPASRAASRGRTPGPKVSPTNGIPASARRVTQRSSSADSTRNDRLHSRVHTHSRQSRTGTVSSTQNGQPQSDENNPNEFERVEAIICPNCPVHGRRSSSNGGRNNEISIPVSRSPPKSSPAQRPASSGSLAQHLAPEQIEPRRASSGDASQIKVVEPLNVAKTDTPPSQNEAAEVSDCGSFTETLQTISTPGRSPATPCFNPSTPKAMVLNTNDLDVEPLFSGHLDGSEKTPTTQCADMGTIAPTSSVA